VAELRRTRRNCSTTKASAVSSISRLKPTCGTDELDSHRTGPVSAVSNLKSRQNWMVGCWMDPQRTWNHCMPGRTANRPFFVVSG
jgi:hypothetical protein